MLKSMGRVGMDRSVSTVPLSFSRAMARAVWRSTCSCTIPRRRNLDWKPLTIFQEIAIFFLYSLLESNSIDFSTVMEDVWPG